MAAPPEVTITDQVTRLYEIIAGYHSTQMLEIGRELGIWEYLTTEGSASVEKISAALGLDSFYTDVLCRTAFSAGVVERDGEGWRMAPHMDLLLGSPGAAFDLARVARVHMLLGNDYRQYADAFRNGSTLSYQAHDRAFMEEVALALRSLPSMFVEAVLPQLPEVQTKLGNANRILDVGCGGGWAVVKLAETYPNAAVVGIDIEPVSVQLADKLVHERGLTDRCEIILGDASSFASGERFDVATLFLVYHEIEPELKRTVLESVFQALAPGGTLVLFDEVYPEAEDELRVMPTRFSALAQWYELIWGNVIGTRSDVLDDCRSTGFTVTKELPFSRFHIVVCERPQ